jgi:PKD repeat protein
LSGDNHIWLKDTTNIDSVYWDFGDSTYSWLFYPKHVYADTGYYQTKAIIFYDNTSEIFEREIRISNYAYADFGIADHSQCLKGNSFHFFDSSYAVDGSMTYQWDFGDSSGSFQQNPVKSYLSADTFQVKLTVTSSYGCETSVSKNVYVLPMPVPFVLLQ